MTIYLGSSVQSGLADGKNKANIDFSNITATAKDMFVTKATEQTITGNKVFEGEVNLNNSTTVNGNITLNNTTTINGTTTLKSTTTVSGNATFSGTTALNGTTTTKTQDQADSSTKLATTAFVKGNIKLVSALPANPIQGVLYCIPEK